MKAMRAIIYKELCENVTWLALLMLAVGVAIGFGADSSVSEHMSIVGHQFQLATAISFPVAGLVVAMLQIFQDDKSSRAPFILHRPIGRTRVLAAKIVSGLSIYLIAVCVPLLLVVFEVTCGRWARQPFDWRMTLPAVSDIIGGMLCYFTGMLIAARQARWIGSRVMPIGLAFLTLLAAFMITPTFGYAMLFIGGGLLITAPAASAAFIARGGDERPVWIVRSLLAICVGTGIGLVLGAAWMIGGEFARSLLYPHARDNWSYSYYSISRDGQPIVITYSQGVSKAADLNGKPLADELAEGERGFQSAWPRAFLRNRSQWDQNQSFSERLQWSTFRTGRSHLDPLTYNLAKTDWYFVGGRRTIEGVDVKTGEARGSFGPKSFLPAGVPAKPFPQSMVYAAGIFGPPDQCIVTPTSVDEVDFQRLSARRLFSTTADDPVVSWNRFGSVTWAGKAVRSEEPPGVQPPDLAVQTKSAIHLLKGSTELLRLPIEHGPDEVTDISVASLPTGGFIIWYEDGRIVTTNAAGQVVERQTLPPLKPPVREEYAGQWIQSLQLVAMPPAALLSAEWLRHSGLKPYSALIFPGIFTASSVIAAFWICRRYRLGRAAEITWPILGLLFGPMAVLTLLAVRNLPARIPCPKCGKLRLVNQEECEHCGAEFPEPSDEGIEVFDAEPTQAAYALI